jgi:phosphatidylinositol glycan class O
MLYRIFSPRFMTAAVVLLVVDVVVVILSVGGTRWNMLSVAEVFGYPV